MSRLVRTGIRQRDHHSTVIILSRMYVMHTISFFCFFSSPILIQKKFKIAKLCKTTMKILLIF